MARKPSSHPGFHALVHTGQQHPGFEAGAKKAADPIQINPKHKGLLHKELNVPQGQPIPQSKITAAEHSKDPAERKRAFFADNAKHKFEH